ncbi:MAG: hypothetical protein HY795_18375 [Desulfovibrio sp.]|nr:hypothetical protein [Desulfovibrio sp.]MBI4960658.1 hypothetical protein [Desulfovibrio sp.]
MAKSYLLYRCGGNEQRLPVAIFTADGVDEAREAPTWLRRRHPENELLVLGPGEFFEVIEEGQCPPDEWKKAAARLEHSSLSGREG